MERAFHTHSKEVQCSFVSGQEPLGIEVVLQVRPERVPKKMLSAVTQIQEKLQFQLQRTSSLTICTLRIPKLQQWYE